MRIPRAPTRAAWQWSWRQDSGGRGSRLRRVLGLAAVAVLVYVVSVQMHLSIVGTGSATSTESRSWQAAEAPAPVVRSTSSGPVSGEAVASSPTTSSATNSDEFERERAQEEAPWAAELAVSSDSTDACDEFLSSARCDRVEGLSKVGIPVKFFTRHGPSGSVLKLYHFGPNPFLKSEPLGGTDNWYGLEEARVAVALSQLRRPLVTDRVDFAAACPFFERVTGVWMRCPSPPTEWLSSARHGPMRGSCWWNDRRGGMSCGERDRRSDLMYIATEFVGQSWDEHVRNALSATARSASRMPANETEAGAGAGAGAGTSGPGYRLLDLARTLLMQFVVATTVAERAVGLANHDNKPQHLLFVEGPARPGTAWHYALGPEPESQFFVNPHDGGANVELRLIDFHLAGHQWAERRGGEHWPAAVSVAERRGAEKVNLVNTAYMLTNMESRLSQALAASAGSTSPVQTASEVTAGGRISNFREVSELCAELRRMASVMRALATAGSSKGRSLLAFARSDPFFGPFRDQRSVEGLQLIHFGFRSEDELRDLVWQSVLANDALYRPIPERVPGR